MTGRETRDRQATEDPLNLRAEMNHGQASGFSSSVSDRLIGPVNVFRLEVGNVALRTAKMPAQFVEIAPLRVFLLLDDEKVFLDGDGAFGPKAHLRPKPFRNDRPGKPVHRETKIVELAQVDIGADGARFEAGQKVLRLSLNNHAIANQVQSSLLRGAAPAIPGRTVLPLDDGIQGGLH